ncbi:MAG: 50S ribosomal protein L40e [Candidatus Aenigmatarchaeota archaeon]
MDDAARKRLFNNVFVCMRCNAKIKADGNKVKAGKIRCRKCGSHDLRPKSREDRS